MSTSNKRIVILGAGYGGIFLATNIARYMKEKIGEVILVASITSRDSFSGCWF